MAPLDEDATEDKDNGGKTERRDGVVDELDPTPPDEAPVDAVDDEEERDPDEARLPGMAPAEVVEEEESEAEGTLPGTAEAAVVDDAPKGKGFVVVDHDDDDTEGMGGAGETGAGSFDDAKGVCEGVDATVADVGGSGLAESIEEGCAMELKATVVREPAEARGAEAAGEALVPATGEVLGSVVSSVGTGAATADGVPVGVSAEVAPSTKILPPLMVRIGPPSRKLTSRVSDPNRLGRRAKREVCSGRSRRGAVRPSRWSSLRKDR